MCKPTTQFKRRHHINAAGNKTSAILKLSCVLFVEYPDTLLRNRVWPKQRKTIRNIVPIRPPGEDDGKAVKRAICDRHFA